MPNSHFLTSVDNNAQPYTIQEEHNLIIQNAFLGVLVDDTYSWIDSFVKVFDKSARDSLGNGIAYRQHTKRSTTIQVYEKLLGTGSSGTEEIIHDTVDIVQVYFNYDKVLYKNFGLDRRELVSVPSTFNIIQITSMSLANTIQRFYYNTVIHELIYATKRGGQLFYLDTADAALGKRGTKTPTAVTTGTAAEIAEEFFRQYTTLIDKFVRDNTVIDGTHVHRDANFNNDKWNVYIDSDELKYMSASLATQIGNNVAFGLRGTGDGNDINGNVVFETTNKIKVKVVKNLKTIIPRALKEIKTIESDSRPNIPGIDDNFAPVLIIVPNNEIATDMFYQDRPQISKTNLSLQEKQIFASYKVLAKSIGSRYKNTNTSTNAQTASIIPNSNLIGVWTRSNTPTGINDTYDNFKIIMNNGVLEEGAYLNQKDIKKNTDELSKIKSEVTLLKELLKKKNVK